MRIRADERNITRGNIKVTRGVIKVKLKKRSESLLKFEVMSDG